MFTLIFVFNVCITPWLASSHLFYSGDLDLSHREKHFLITFWHIIASAPDYIEIYLFGQLRIRLQSFCNSISFSRNFEPRQNLMLQYFQAKSEDEFKFKLSK